MSEDQEETNPVEDASELLAEEAVEPAPTLPEEAFTADESPEDPADEEETVDVVAHRPARPPRP